VRTTGTQQALIRRKTFSISLLCSTGHRVLHHPNSSGRMDQKSNEAAEIWQWDRWRTAQKDKNVRFDHKTDPESHTRP